MYDFIKKLHKAKGKKRPAKEVQGHAPPPPVNLKKKYVRFMCHFLYSSHSFIIYFE